MSSAARERGEHAPFGGFVTGGAAVTLPAQLFAELLPQIEDECELRVTLHALFAVARARGQLRAVRATALAPDPALAAALARLGGQPALAGALAAAVRRGTLLVCPLADGDALYFVNSEGGRRNLLRVQSGALAVPGTAPLPPPAPEPAAPVRVYESEIGALTPAVTAALAEAAERYPEQWIVDALQLAAERNARSWRYAAAVLRRWEAEGRDDAASERDAAGAAGDDPYAHLIHR